MLGRAARVFPSSHKSFISWYTLQDTLVSVNDRDRAMEHF